MTEESWRQASPEKMLYFLHSEAGGRRGAGGEALARKAQLFACACVRRALGGLERPWQRPAVEAGEAFADGLCGMEVVQEAKDAACGQFDCSYWAASTDDCWGAVEAAWHSGCFRTKQGVDRCADLVRCVFGNPFRSVTLGTSWLTAMVTSLAEAAYDERTLPSAELDAERLGVLSDALEEAGCTDEAILCHLRAPTPHVRGCWAVDLILGKR